MANFTGDDSDAFASGMLEKGYFPDNLPSPYCVANFYESVKLEINSKTYMTSKTTTENIRFNASKRNRQRRIFSTPNPIFMIDSAIYFNSYADNIEEHFSLSSDSCSIPRFDIATERPIQIDSFNEFYLKRRSKLAESRYIVKSDISRFFSSIYTHCIPWSLHGKSSSKSDKNYNSGLIFGNRLDYIIRQHQDGQTVGVPIGPDFSRIVSEIVGVKIDRIFREKAGSENPLLRLVDDIYIGTDNLDDANTKLGIMRDSIRELELDINESKTIIIDASKDVESYWPVEIRHLLEKYKEYDHKFEAEFIQTLDKIIQMALIDLDDGLIKYALRKIDNEWMWNDYWDSFEPFLIRCCISFPHSWNFVAQIVALRHDLDGIDTKKWSRVIEKSLSQNVKSGNDFEVVWAIWLSIHIKAPIINSLFDEIFEKCGSYSMLSALHLHSISAMDCKIPKEKILSRLGNRPMLGPHWILAYEGDRKFDLKIKTKNTQGYDLFKILYDNDVSFYSCDIEENKGITKINKKPAIKSMSSYDDSDIDIIVPADEEEIQF